jgi:NTE family protein
MVENVALVLGGGGSAGRMDDRCHRRAGRSWHRYDRGRRSGDWHVVRGHRCSAGAQRHPASRTVRFDRVSAGSTGQTEPAASTRTADVRRLRADEAIGAAATSAVDLFRAMGEFGLESDATLGPEAAEQRRAMVAARLPRRTGR